MYKTIKHKFVLLKKSRLPIDIYWSPFPQSPVIPIVYCWSYQAKGNYIYAYRKWVGIAPQT